MFSHGKLVHESEWMRVYESDDGIRLHESKFLIDGIQVSTELIVEQWPHLSPAEKLEFANAFSVKPKITPEDERILDFLMEAGDFYIWMTVACQLPYHRNRQRVLKFLLDRIRENPADRANFFQAIELMKDENAAIVPVLRAIYDDYRRKLREVSGSVEEIDCKDYLQCCKALLSIEGSSEYRRAIEEFSKSPNGKLRSLAQSLLGED